MPPFVEGLRALAADRATVEDDAKMPVSLSRMRPWVLAIWAGLLASAVLGMLGARG